MRKLLFFDIDGTLLSEINHNIPESAIEALKKTREAGNLIFVNTGRVVSVIPKDLFQVEFDGFLCGCGTDIFYRGENVYRNELSIETRKDILRICAECKMGSVLEGPEMIYYRNEDLYFYGVDEIRNRFTGIYPLSEGWDPLPEFSKLIAFYDANSDKERFRKEISQYMEVIERERDMFELVPAGHSKATAIDYCVEKFGISLEDSYVFGDSSNDLPMFEHVPNAVVMGHHSPILEPYTTFYADTVENDGLYKAMEELGLF